MALGDYNYHYEWNSFQRGDRKYTYIRPKEVHRSFKPALTKKTQQFRLSKATTEPKNWLSILDQQVEGEC